MTIGLFSLCLGCNATMFAMTRRPGVFDGVRCMVSPQPLSSGVAPAVRRSRQLYGYTYSSEPEQMLHWFARFMA
ncbi:hypothetical protein [Sinorhizobium meliloti]|uniref:hypothetical protein n=1 Tax=Rhizobium meliloti TaxID=382 RepID=UPI0020913C77|nr:hypothetical protein [Sinorhizobium meliloti]MCO5965542.1 hypothetical protein [Sinorhizobium meliloti]